MKKPRINLLIIPEDFKSADFGDIRQCPLARAFKRYVKENNLYTKFKQLDILVGTCSIDVYDGNDRKELINIVDGFTTEDFNFVKAIKEPYPIELVIVDIFK